MLPILLTAALAFLLHFLLLLAPLRVLLLLVLPRHHGEGGGRHGGAQTGFGEVHGLVVFGLGELDDLVGSEGRGGEADDEVDFLAEVDVFGVVAEELLRRLWSGVVDCTQTVCVLVAHG